MNACEETVDSDVYRPSPGLVLALQYHPELSVNHPVFSQLPRKEQYLLTQMDAQSRRWKKHPYFRNSIEIRRIALLNGYHRRDRLVQCKMLKYNSNHTMAHKRCGLSTFCPFCAYLKGQDILNNYSREWESGTWWKLVFSLKKRVPLIKEGGERLDRIWDTMRAVIHACRGTFDACVGWEEIAVNSFWPEVLLTPHFNALLQCENDINSRLWMSTAKNKWRSRRLNGSPDILLEPVKTESHFYNFLRYIKPIDLLTPYDSGYEIAKNDNQLESFHQNVGEFFSGYHEAITIYRKFKGKSYGSYSYRPISRSMMLYLGKCHGSSKRYFGVKERLRRSRKWQEATKIRVQNAQEAEQAMLYSRMDT